MKEKIKNYIFCLCALAMCLAFALAVFLRASKNVKAASLTLGSNITYNEGQTLYTTISGVDWGLQVNRGNSTSVYQVVMTPYTQSSTYNYMMIARNCSVGSYDNSYFMLTCISLSYIPLTSGTISTNSSVSSSNPITFIQFEENTIDGNTFYLQQNILYNGSSSTSLAANIRWSQLGKNYADGYIAGFNDATLKAYNNLYYSACLQTTIDASTCSLTYFTDTFGTAAYQLTPLQVLNSISSLFGYSSLYTPSEIYDFIRSKYNSNYNYCLSISSSCSSWSSQSLDLSNLEYGLNAYITNSNLITGSINYDSAYQTGRADGIVVGVEDGKIIGYQQGFIDGQQAEDIVGNAVLSVASTPLMVLSGMLNFDILGFSVYSLVLALFTFLLVIYIIKKVFF